jgi:hypothetical protein
VPTGRRAGTDFMSSGPQGTFGCGGKALDERGLGLGVKFVLWFDARLRGAAGMRLRVACPGIVLL